MYISNKVECPNCKTVFHEPGAKYCHICGAHLDVKPDSGGEGEETSVSGMDTANRRKGSFFGALSSRFRSSRLIVRNGTVVGIDDKSSPSTLVIPAYVKGERVTSIGDWSFNSNHALVELVLPDTLLDIGTAAFQYCENLTEIVFPESLERIGDYAFIGCESLAEITIPASVTWIGRHAFWNCENLKTAYVKSRDTVIEEKAFRDGVVRFV